MKQYLIPVLILLIAFITSIYYQTARAQSGKEAVLIIKKTTNFALTGDGSAANWSTAQWIQLAQLSSKNEVPPMATRVKVLYSDTGMYFLFECQDQVLNATMTSNFMKLWKEDVVEVFLWPDETSPTYFEYELSPLNYELPILVSNKKGNLAHWIPFSYSYNGTRRTRHQTSVTGGKKESGASIRQWTAEFFIPFELLRPLNNIPPESGTHWRGNLYRIDYDMGQTLYAWQPNSGNFHEYKKFGTFLFE